MSELVVIKSNLAVPCDFMEDPACLPNPYWERAIENGRGDNFSGPEAFMVPSEINLRVAARGQEELDDELLEIIAQLGHGVNLLIARDHPETHVGLDAHTEGKRKPFGQQLSWSVIGIARIPLLGAEAMVYASGIPGHRARSGHTLPGTIDLHDRTPAAA